MLRFNKEKALHFLNSNKDLEIDSIEIFKAMVDEMDQKIGEEEPDCIMVDTNAFGPIMIPIEFKDKMFDII